MITHERIVYRQCSFELRNGPVEVLVMHQRKAAVVVSEIDIGLRFSKFAEFPQCPFVRRPIVSSSKHKDGHRQHRDKAAVKVVVEDASGCRFRHLANHSPNDGSFANANGK